jgi:hypothetical protein
MPPLYGPPVDPTAPPPPPSPTVPPWWPGPDPNPPGSSAGSSSSSGTSTGPSPSPSPGPASGGSACEKQPKRKTRKECTDRFIKEKAFCSRYYGTVLYGMCRDRAAKRNDTCLAGLPDPGPLDPLDPDWSID